MTKTVERFLKYVKYDTKSDEESTLKPSTKNQLVFAKYLADELIEIGLSDVSLDENGYVMATLNSNIEKEVPTVGFIAHMDTSPDMSGTTINPKLIEKYDGKDIVLNTEENIILKVKEFPNVKNYIGKTLITTDGTTLLGADDKAGIAEIVSAMEELINNPNIPHGTIKIAFTPDEEIGAGADTFDVVKFAADFAYTIDGGTIGELEYENFNASKAKITIKGRNIHPGSAKNKMKNAVLIGHELQSMLPQDETPAKTEGYEGFFHLDNFNGNVEQVQMSYIIRDFDLDNLKIRESIIANAAKKINNKYGEDTVSIDLKDQYLNMKEKIEPVMHIVNNAKLAMEQVGIKPLIKPIRGGTDGSRLSYMGLPTPNIFTGGENFHGRFEYIPTFAMEKAVEVILKIVQIYSK